MIGGLFTINRDYFYEIGSYDEDMAVWDEENLEMSFLVWQSRGKVFIHPLRFIESIDLSHIGKMMTLSR